MSHVVVRARVRVRSRSHDFRLTKGNKWNALWTSSHLKSYVFQVRASVRVRDVAVSLSRILLSLHVRVGLQGLSRFQKVNQFPRSFEVTRKDTLARNMGRMQQVHGARHFQFFPTTFILPRDKGDLVAHLSRRDEVRLGLARPAPDAPPPLLLLLLLSSSSSCQVPPRP
jgi:hypothetical protein